MTIPADTVLTGDCRQLVPLLETLIRTSCAGGGVVADWFAGSGMTGKTRRLSGRCDPWCEIDAATAEKAHARIAAIVPFDEWSAP
jgi:hypothetical protein